MCGPARMSAAWTRHRALYLVLFALVFATTIYTSYHLVAGRPNRLILPIAESCERHYRLQPVEALQPQPWEKGQDGHPAIDLVIPPGVNIIALVFFGRRRLVRVLDCYLQRNLRHNGGLLDHVIFAINTDNEDDLAYLDDLVAANPQYSKHVPDKTKHDRFVGLWAAVSEPESVYVKIDDDVVFIEDSTIPAIVKRVLENPQYFAVSANIVNNPALSWVHHRMGVNKPYWPEMEPTTPSPRRSWRSSELPSYSGKPEGPGGFAINGSSPAPYKGHRWLPVRPAPDENYDINLSPASTITFDAFGPGLHNWAAAAQIHYSFLDHLEQGDTWRYKFTTFDFAYQRLSINLFALRGRDIIDVFPFPGNDGKEFSGDDEHYLTVTRPTELKRHVVVDGAGLAAHFAFRRQYTAHGDRGVGWTDLLERYQLYADTIYPNNVHAANTSAKRPQSHG